MTNLQTIQPARLLLFVDCHAKFQDTYQMTRGPVKEKPKVRPAEVRRCRGLPIPMERISRLPGED